MEIEEEIKSAFKSPIGEQCDELFSTSDGRIFIRFKEAESHAAGELEPFSDPLLDRRITIWYNDFRALSSVQRINTIQSAIEQLEHDHPEFMEEHTTGWDMMESLRLLKKEFEG